MDLPVNIYLLTQDEEKGYDTWSSLIVTATNEEEARQIHPRIENPIYNETYKDLWECSGWASSPDNVKVQLIGVASPGIKCFTIIQYCFHAG